MRVRAALAAAAVMLVCAVSAAGADAATFCVHSGAFTCPAGSTDEAANLQTALNDAAGAPGRDTVVIGPGAYDAGASPPFSYTSSDPIDVVGTGGPGDNQNATVLEDTSAASSTESALTLTGNASSTVSDLQVVIPTGSSTGGLDTDAEADRIVASPGTGIGTFETGVKLEAGARLRHSYINNGGAIFAATVLGANTLIEDSHLLSNVDALGSTTANVSVTLRRSRLDAQIPAQLVAGGTLVAEDVLAVVRRDTPSVGPTGFILQTGSGSPVEGRFDHLTLVAFGQNASAFQVSSGTGTPATLTVRNSIVSGWQNLVVRSGNTTPANASFSYSDVVPQNPAFDSGPGSITQSSTVDVDPQYLSSTNDDYRLASGSPLVDAGDPAGLSAGESTTDLGGEPRIVDASGSCTPRTDMGAYERQAGPRAPHAAATASAANALTGQPLGFDASGSCDPDGDALAYLWHFDDGAIVAGPVVQHAFAAPGRHSATVTVTDATGRATTATTSVLVIKRFGGVTLASRTIKVSPKGVASPRLRCPAASMGRCTGTLKLTAKKKLGSAKFGIAPGKTKAVKVKLSKAARRTLRRRGRLKASALIDARDGSGQSKRTSAKVKLLAPKRR